MKNYPESGIYQHYKGNLYHVLEVGRHSETLEDYIVYRALYDDYGLWVRPLTLFQEFVEVDGTSVPRFKFLRKVTLSHPNSSLATRGHLML